MRAATLALDASAGAGAAGPDAPDDVAATRQARARLARVVGALSRRDRALVALAVDEERAPQEIAVIMEMSEGACRVALHRALSRVKARMHVS